MAGLVGHPRLAVSVRLQDVDARLEAGHDARVSVPDPLAVMAAPSGRHGRACPGHPRLAASVRLQDVDARLKAGHEARRPSESVNRRSAYWPPPRLWMYTARDLTVTGSSLASHAGMTPLRPLLTVVITCSGAEP
jgi:hypothetical protein